MPHSQAALSALPCCVFTVLRSGWPPLARFSTGLTAYPRDDRRRITQLRNFCCYLLLRKSCYVHRRFVAFSTSFVLSFCGRVFLGVAGVCSSRMNKGLTAHSTSCYRSVSGTFS